VHIHRHLVPDELLASIAPGWDIVWMDSRYAHVATTARSVSLRQEEPSENAGTGPSWSSVTSTRPFGWALGSGREATV
jgi:hypothetical protein